MTKIPKELIDKWFINKMNIRFSDEDLKAICLEIDNKAINYSRCSAEFETVEVDKDLVKSIDKLQRSNGYKKPTKKRF
tara:strand:+ start:851 stop:1084 length:234 start_codon:yes stop_codon:yes gene_type:complete